MNMKAIEAGLEDWGLTLEEFLAFVKSNGFYLYQQERDDHHFVTIIARYVCPDYLEGHAVTGKAEAIDALIEMADRDNKIFCTTVKLNGRHNTLVKEWLIRKRKMEVERMDGEVCYLVRKRPSDLIQASPNTMA